MNFFKSILSDDPDPPRPEHVRGSEPDSPLRPPNDDGNSKEVAGGDPADGWSFGGLIKTLAIRSESVIEIYRRDLQEFKSGLQKETEILRETASRAAKDLPASLEARASAAHGALGGVLKSTAEIISKETRIFASDGEPETPETNRSLNSGRYSWFDAQLTAIQSDLNTFCEDPEDVEEYTKWKSGFELEQNRDEINILIGENGALEGVYKKFVPNAVDPETFWCRYFYRVDKLKQQESVRASLVKRAISVDDDEELSWDVDDDEEDGNGSERMSGKVKGGDGLRENVAAYGNLNPVQKQEDLNSGSKDKNEGGDVNNVNMDDGEKKTVVETVESSKKSSTDDFSGKQEVKSEEVAEVKFEEVAEVKRDENVKFEENVKEKDDEKVSVEEKDESSKKSNAPVVSSHESKVEEEEDMGWDEIEDITSVDEKKISARTTHGGNPNRAELQKRLSAVEDDDDDDLNWDIEDDDEPVKA